MGEMYKKTHGETLLADKCRPVPAGEVVYLFPCLAVSFYPCEYTFVAIREILSPASMSDCTGCKIIAKPFVGKTSAFENLNFPGEVPSEIVKELPADKRIRNLTVFNNQNWEAAVPRIGASRGRLRRPTCISFKKLLQDKSIRIGS